MASAAFALPLTMAAVWLGAQRGPIGVAASIATINLVLVVPRLWWALKDLPEGLTGYVRALLGPIAATTALSVGLWLGRSSVGHWDWPYRIGFSISGGLLALIILIAAWPRLRHEWRMVLHYLPRPSAREK